MASVHIVGAGLAGLACAVRLAQRGCSVSLYESAPQAGGRCRSFFDRTLQRQIDNGNHLLLSANRAALAYVDAIGAADSLVGPPQAAFPFVDLATGARWTVRPNPGRLPWWLFVASRRVPGTRPRDYLSGLRLAWRPEATVADRIAGDHPLYHRFWEPLTLAAVNAPPERAAAGPLWTVVRETFARGGAYCRPLVAGRGLAASLVEPALKVLERAGAAVQFGRRVRAVRLERHRAVALDTTDGPVALTAQDRLVVAVPPSAAAALLPGLQVPEEGEAIVNAHFRLPRPVTLPEGSPFLGIIGGAAHWVFARDDVASVTVSGALELVDRPAADLAELLWADTAAALALPPEPSPPARLVKEKRATFTQTPQNQRRRPGTVTAWSNVLLAGDWTDTGLPATIEGAVRSGQAAADRALAA